MSLFYHLLVLLGCDPKPTISNEELMRITDEALDEHIKNCSKCNVTNDPDYGETLEEAGALVEIGPLYSLLNVPHAEQVHLFYLAAMSTPHFLAGEESLEVALFDEKDIPWAEIAFPTVKQTLEWFFADRAAGLFEGSIELNVRSRDVLRGEKI